MSGACRPRHGKVLAAFGLYFAAGSDLR